MSFKILTKTDNIIDTIADCARTCYRSEKFSSKDSNKKLVKNFINKGHEAMLEFADIIVRFDDISRLMTHQLVRHRLASFAQESTRYCSYDKKTKRNINCKFNIEEEKEIIDIYNDGNTTNHIAKLYGCNQQTIFNILTSNEIKIRESGDYCISEKLLESFLPENINNINAQILGFIFADGNLYKSSSNSYRITIKIKDIEYLKQLKMLLGGNIYHYKNDGFEGLIQLSICSKTLYNILKNVYGCEENKSLKLRYDLLNKNLPKKHLSSFVRGFFEGDGSIGWYKKYHKRQLTFSSGTKDFLVWLSKIISENCNVTEKQIYKKTRSYNLVYNSKSDIYNILKWMYSDLSFELILMRKLLISNTLCDLNDIINNSFLNFCNKYNIVIPNINNDDLENKFNYLYNTQLNFNMYNCLKGTYKNDDRRMFLPNNIKTSIVIKANIREWRKIFELRTDKHAHWEIRKEMVDLLELLKKEVPLLFDDFIYYGMNGGIKHYVKKNSKFSKVQEYLKDILDSEQNNKIIDLFYS